MSNLRASIVVNNFNYGRFLREAVDSALAQTYRTEVIVVDDGSTDDSRDIIASYGSRIIPVLKSNGGQGSTYNSGFSVSSGDFVCFLDSDDKLYPDAMRQVAETMSQPDVVKVQWPLVVTDAAGTPTGRLSNLWTPPEGDLSEMVIRDGPFYDFDLTTGSAYARSMLKRVFPMPEPPYRNGADVYLITVAPVFGLIRNLAEALGIYRAHGQNNYRGRALDDARVRNYIARFEANCAALHRILRDLGKQSEPELWRQRNFNYLWPTRLLRARQDLFALVPEGAGVILVDENEWGGDQCIPGRRMIPFLERDGEYWGPPADDQAAICELERLRLAGAGLIAFWWTAFWWLEHYTGFFEYLRQKYRCVLQADHLVVFNLHEPAGN